MHKLTVLTFSDAPLANSNNLKKSCQELGLDLQVILHTPWEFNAIKIKLLYEWLNSAAQDCVVLIVDAFDVVIYDDAPTLLQKFEAIEGDILFSAEANFYFRNKKQIKKYWRAYPRSNAPYDYLNSGTFMGKASDLIAMIDHMISTSALSLDMEVLRAIRSDQYVYSKNYVDTFSQSNHPLIRLDHEQRLMGCSGGRFAVIPFPDLSKLQAFLFFLLERNLLKAVKLHRFQNQSKDFRYETGRFFNKKTRQYPGVIHFPGTWENFGEALEKMKLKRQLTLKNPFAVGISLLSWMLSILLSVLLFLPLQVRSKSL